MRVEVTQEDIDNGTPRSNESCPIALAILRKRGVRWVRAARKIRVRRGRFGDETWYEAPEEALDFMAWYDDGHARPPFAFKARRLG